jgi:ATP-binding cassette subfamily B protein
VATAFKADAKRATGMLTVSAVEGLVRAAFPLWLKLLADGAFNGDLGRVGLAAAANGMSLGALGILNITRVNLTAGLHERTAFVLDEELMSLSMRAPTLEPFENAAFRNELELLRSRRAALGGTITALASNILVGATFVGTVGLLASVHPVLIALPLFSLVSLSTTRRSADIRVRADEAVIERTRTANHLFRLATTPEAGKELRIFGLGDELGERHAKLWRERDQILKSADWRGAAVTSAGWAVFGVGYAGALGLVVWSAVTQPQSTTPGDVLMAFRAAESVNEVVSGMAQLVGWLTRNLATVGRLLWLRDVVEKSEQGTGGVADVPTRIKSGIRFDGVNFAYPDSDRPALQGIDLELPAGATVALVGENGAGKSTLVKLMCRFYEPTAGTITIDGTELSVFALDAWRREVAAAFQDFARFEFLLREAVGVGDVAHIDEDTAVEVALRRAHASDVTVALPAGLDTQLGRSFEGGLDLSLGQWQKVALGRAMMQEAPLVMVLDEPTASLDAETEHMLFERYRDAARHAAKERGAITLLVSHRFSTVRMADLIVVLAAGRIVESGSHRELTRLGGLYAELYDLQAGAYR